MYLVRIPTMTLTDGILHDPHVVERIVAGKLVRSVRIPSSGIIRTERV